MFRKKSLTGEVLHEERIAYDAILRANASKARAMSQELIWADTEENPFLLVLFGKLAELQYMYSEAEKQMAEKFLEVSKAFRHISQEERIVEETKREQLNYLTKVTKLKKHLEGAKKKGDQAKLQHLEAEYSAQGNLYNQLSLSVEAKAKKLEEYKISLLKKGLRHQAEGMLTLSGHCQQLYAARMELIDYLPDAPPSTSSGEATEKEKDDLNRRMSAVVNKVSEILSITAPPNGGIELRRPRSSSPSLSSSPGISRRSLIEPFSFLGGRKEILESSGRVEKRKRFSSCSADKLECVLSECNRSTPNPSSPAPSNPVPILPAAARPSPPHHSPPAKPSAHCEIMIPSAHTSEKPKLAKKNKSSVSSINSGESEEIVMSTRFDQRLKEAGLLKQQSDQTSINSTSHSSSPYSSMEDIPLNSEDPGYAKLVILPSGPVHPKSNAPERIFLENVEDEDDDDDDEGGYANPADALKLMNPRVRQINQAQFGNTPSPPLSPVHVTDPSRDGFGKTSPYESVEEIRKMRERQMKAEEEKENQMKKSPTNVSSSSGITQKSSSDSKVLLQTTAYPYDDDPGYSRPFDALNSKKFVVGSEMPPPKKLPHSSSWHRTSSGDKIGKEPSARFLHQVGPSSEKVSPERLDSVDVIPRSSSVNSKLTLENPRIGVTPSSKVSSSNGHESGKMSCIDGSRTQVNRYILKTERNQAPPRSETGRTASIDSALRSLTGTPAKVTKLRNGRDHVAVITGPRPPKNTDKK